MDFLGGYKLLRWSSFRELLGGGAFLYNIFSLTALSYIKHKYMYNRTRLNE